MTDIDTGLQELRILAVDDEASNLLLVQRALERAGYTQIVTTTDPMKVVGMFAEQRPDLVLLDLDMPGIDGFQLMEHLAPATGPGPGVPILVLTADATDATKRRALAAGARDFLTKPLDKVELTLRVRNLLQVRHLQRRLADQNANLEAEVAERTRDLEFDPAVLDAFARLDHRTLLEREQAVYPRGRISAHA
jgi:putative two-component system response regulator